MKQYYKAIADFFIEGFREVKAGEFITISPEIVTALQLTDKLELEGVKVNGD